MPQQASLQKAQIFWVDFIAIGVALVVVVKEIVLFVFAHARGLGAVASAVAVVYGILYRNLADIGLFDSALHGSGVRFNPDWQFVMMGLGCYTIGVMLNKLYAWWLNIRNS